jgi:hypothetical protein
MPLKEVLTENGQVKAHGVGHKNAQAIAYNSE